MGKFGKKSKVNNNLWNYNVGLLGESGIGKTTLMSKVCDKLVGEDGYILLNIGKEDGVKCIDGVIYEDVPNYKAWNEITTDIIKNKETDYPDLKIVVVDTLDQLFELGTAEAIRQYNNDNLGKKDFTPAKSLNSVYGGFGRGEDAVIDLLLDRIWKLKSVGVAFYYTGHVKNREISDAVTGHTYSTLTTNMMQRFFNAVKTKTDVLGIACIDREIIKEELGRKDIITKKEVTRNKISSESRIIKFRDDNYSVDSKSRFANIIDEIPLDPDAFIKAIKDAINDARSSDDIDNSNTVTNNSESKTPAKTKAKKAVEVDTEETKVVIEVKDEYSESDDVEENIFNEEVEDTKETVNKTEILETIRLKFKNADKEIKSMVRTILKDNGYSKLSEEIEIDVLNEIMEVLE